MRPRFALALGALALLGGCNSEQNDRRTASGQILAGTISDDMLPVDTVSSQPPLMKAAPDAGAAKPSQEPAAAQPEGASPPAEGPAGPEPDAPPDAGATTR